MNIVGILNVTTDSFSDGGAFLSREMAIAHGEKLFADGADWLDVGAESSHPKSSRVSAEVEIERLTPVVSHFAGRNVSVDTYKPEVMAAMSKLGARMINDIRALENDASRAAVRDAGCLAVIMFWRHEEGVLRDQMWRFFEERIDLAVKAGITRDKLILDTGMGFFLGNTPAPSVEALQLLPALKRDFGLPVYAATSRKSFISALTGHKAVAERGPGTLASELFALHQGVDYIRTHDVRALKDAATVWNALAR